MTVSSASRSESSRPSHAWKGRGSSFEMSGVASSSCIETQPSNRSALRMPNQSTPYSAITARASATDASSATTGPCTRPTSLIGMRDNRLMPRSEPRNPSTKASAGVRRISTGVSYCWRMPPMSRIATLSPNLIASSMSWVTSTIVLFTLAWRSRSSSWRRPLTIGSTAPKGASISITGGSAASALATPTRWRWPPDSSAG